MKRVYLILTLFIASFFFVSLNKVRAETIDFEIPESEINYINDEFLEFRDIVIKFCNDYNKNYIISYENSLKAYIFNPTITPRGSYGWGAGINRFPVISIPDYVDSYVLSNDANSLVVNENLSAASFLLANSDRNQFSYLHYLDSNVLNINYTESSITFNIKYNDLIYELNKDSNFPSLYQIYMDSKPDEPIVSDKFIEEKEIINNFYLTIFTKISDIATIVANNYTFLIIFGIFILIFVLELIRRYLL